MLFEITKIYESPPALKFQHLSRQLFQCLNKNGIGIRVRRFEARLEWGTNQLRFLSRGSLFFINERGKEGRDEFGGCSSDIHRLITVPTGQGFGSSREIPGGGR